MRGAHANNFQDELFYTCDLQWALLEHAWSYWFLVLAPARQLGLFFMKSMAVVPLIW
jgi:hypothetical protein